MKNLIKLLLSAAVFLPSCATTRLPQNSADYAKSSAMVTLENKRSGGSGVVLKSTAGYSLILTNKHVCGLIQVGGVVTTDEGTYPVSSFRVYKQHDLCLIKVLADLHQNNRIAEAPPKSYSDLTVAGHPQLLPTIVNRGVFADHMSIQMMIDTQPCDGTESDQDAMMCFFMGGQKPVLQSFETQPITATIMHGSSGSGVFNDRGEIAGLVFAGGEGLGYGFIVPYEYVRDFVTHLSKYPEQFPNKSANPVNFFTALFKLREACVANATLCRGLVFQGLYNE